jgi:hypothetical protein
LDLEFCENFLETINEKFEIFKANFHPITHIETSDKSLNSKKNIFFKENSLIKQIKKYKLD